MRLTALAGVPVRRVELLGTSGALDFRDNAGALQVTLPGDLAPVPALALKMMTG